MIRLYFDEKFEIGQGVQLPDEEWRYFQSVRRAQGDVLLFNRFNQIASGKWEGKLFRIEKISAAEVPIHPVTLAVGLPETNIVPQIIRSVSELGIQRLILFAAERTQKAKSRLENLSRLEKITIEAARQCGRGIPLQLETKSWADLLTQVEAEKKFFFDEAELMTPNRKKITVPPKNIFLLVGCEGGWTENERQQIQKENFEHVHFDTPVLRVETAATCAAFFGIQVLKKAA
jgi:16S rRNA (uracil1498-N3)-methyltransferase